MMTPDSGPNHFGKALNLAGVVESLEVEVRVCQFDKRCFIDLELSLLLKINPRDEN
jgi:hypothetical protein